MIKIYPSVFKGSLHAPASAAHAMRLLFAASMPAVPTVVRNLIPCDDTDTAISTLEAFGCRTVRNVSGTEAAIEPFAKNVPVPTANFDFKSSATCSRLAIVMAAALGYRAECTADPGLSKRYLVPLTSRIALNGIKVSSFSMPFAMSGRLTPGEYVFSDSEDDRFISALLMALPVLSGDSAIRINAPLTDRSFISLSLETLRSFGIEIEKTADGFFVRGRQQYTSPGTVEAENDWSLASLWICAAALCKSLGGGVKVGGLPLSSPQLYRNIKPALSLIAQDFSDISLDASGAPELATLFAAAALVKGAAFEISGVPQLKFKESDRLKTMAECAEALGGSGSFTEASVKVRGPEGGIPENTVMDCKGDPWIFMSFALASAALQKTIILTDENCPNKIYKNFFRDFVSLGGRVEKIKA